MQQKISKKILAFEEMLELNEDDFSIQKTTGHFDNAITILNSKIVKKQAQKLIGKLLDGLSNEKIEQMVDEIEERTIDSRFHEIRKARDGKGESNICRKRSN